MMNEEINARRGAAGETFRAPNSKFIRKREVSERTKIRIYKSVYTPILTWSESWALTTKRSSKLQAQEMGNLRAVAGKTRRDRVRNTTIRLKLDIQTPQETVKRSQIRWFGRPQDGAETHPEAGDGNQGRGHST